MAGKCRGFLPELPFGSPSLLCMASLKAVDSGLLSYQLVPEPLSEYRTYKQRTCTPASYVSLRVRLLKVLRKSTDCSPLALRLLVSQSLRRAVCVATLEPAEHVPCSALPCPALPCRVVSCRVLSNWERGVPVSSRPFLQNKQTKRVWIDDRVA